MIMSTPLPGFAWIMEGRLAVADVPSSKAHINWLLLHGFQVVVSLGTISRSMELEIADPLIIFLSEDWDARPDERSIELVMEFIEPYFRSLSPVCVFSSLGVEAAADIAKKFVARNDPQSEASVRALVEHLARRANDLNHGDMFDWDRGHEAFCDAKIDLAMSTLTSALSSTDPDTQLAAADTLVEVMEHVGHDCFPQATVRALVEVRAEVQDIVLRLNPKQRPAYETIFRQFDGPPTTDGTGLA